MATAAVFVLASLLAPCRGFLLGIDLGSQYFKAAVVAPGKPFEVVHNQHSKRKTPTAVSFLEKVRTFGDDALASAARGARKTPMFFPSQLGRNLTAVGDAERPWLPTQFYPYVLGVNDSGSLRFDIDDETSYSVEEVTAHLLAFAKGLASATVEGISVSETLLTVPSAARYPQRRALVGAARIAGLPRPQLVHETSVAALQRALDLDLSGANGTANTSTVLYYNMGARHVEACVVRYDAATHMSKPTVAMDVLGCGSSDKLGGHQVDVVIAQRMLEAFKAKHPKLADITKSIRALKKLEKEAMGLKHVLSANREGQFRVESLYEDTDFFYPVTRETLEEWCSEIFADFSKPIEAALDAAKLTLEAVDTVEMIGGGWRIPKIQTLISDYLVAKRPAGMPALNLSQHINGDEAMATGAAFFGANSSISFRTKRIYFTDYSIHHYSLLLEPLNSSQPSEEGWTKDVELFAAGSSLRSRKTVKLTVGFDLRATLFENGDRVGTWDIPGIHEAATTTYAHLETPLVSLKFDLDTSGIVQLASATAIFDEPVPVRAEPAPNASAAAANASATAGNDDNASSEAEGEGAGAAGDEASADAAASAEAAAAAGAEGANATVANKTKIKKRKVPLAAAEAAVTDAMPRGLTAEERSQATERLRALEAADAEVRRIESAKNALESFVYEAREKLGSDEYVLQVSVEETREAIGSNLTNMEEWLYEEEAMTASAELLEEKLKELHGQVGPILRRAQELEHRAGLPELVEKVLLYVNQTLTYVQTNMTWVAAKEVEGVQNTTEQFVAWWENHSAIQAERPLTEDPVFSVNDAKRGLLHLQNEAQRLTKIKKIDPIPYSNDYGRYGSYYDDYFKNFSGGNYSNYSDWFRNFSSNGSNFNYSNFRDSEYMRSFYEHMAKNAKGNFSGDGADAGAGAGAGAEGADAGAGAGAGADGADGAGAGGGSGTGASEANAEGNTEL
eukprot:TRINITY_DN45362_c0_g1_i1.p1 TRINITY_DN45362_c0_g1~~TRINITY_DN45362_c0_g1_i1.p1  ORF type:complete len:1000 (+),score=297.48 TRINITY_DN45362_c0_g1_i1:108-3002(+)